MPDGAQIEVVGKIVHQTPWLECQGTVFGEKSKFVVIIGVGLDNLNAIPVALDVCSRK